jgi:hypothetical protein
MPIKKRHQARTINAGATIATGNNSPSFSAMEADGLVIYATVSAATTLTLQGSSDGGTTWYDLETFSPTGSGSYAYRAIFPVPGLCRIAVGGTGPVTELTYEIARSI